MATEWSDPQARLGWRGTFIEVRSESQDRSLSPRPASEPSSETSSACVGGFFSNDRQNVQHLAQRMDKLWSSHAGRQRSSRHSGVRSETRDAGPFAFETNSSASSSVMYAASAPAGHSSGGVFEGRPSTTAVAGSGITLDAIASMQIAEEEADLAACVRRGKEDFNSIRARYTRHQTLLAAFDNIPEHLGDVLQQKAADLFDEMKGQVDAAVRSLVRVNEEFSVAEATEGLEVIPGNILSIFLASIAHAKHTVRDRVRDLTQGVDNVGFASDKEVAQMWALPHDVQHVVGEAVDEAVRESQLLIIRLLDDVLRSLPSGGPENTAAIRHVKQQVLLKVQETYPDTLRSALELALSTVQNTVAALQDHAVPAPIPNNLVADALLRAKTRHGASGASGSAALPIVAPRPPPANDDGHPAHPADRPGRPTPPLSGRREDDGCQLAGPSTLHRDCSTERASTNDTLSECAQLNLACGSGGGGNADEGSAHPSAQYALPVPARDDSGAPGEMAGIEEVFKSCNFRMQQSSPKGGTLQQGLSTAISTIDSIPDQLDELLHHKADNLATVLETKLTAMCSAIRGTDSCDHSCAERAVARLNQIPDIVHTSFKNKIFRVKGSVQERVSGVIRELRGNKLRVEQIVTQLGIITEEVEQIAGEAVEEALQESEEKACQQLAYALQSLPTAAFEDTPVLSNVKMNISEKVQGVYPEALRAARATAEVNVEHAIAAVERASPGNLEEAGGGLFAGAAPSSSSTAFPTDGAAQLLPGGMMAAVTTLARPSVQGRGRREAEGDNSDNNDEAQPPMTRLCADSSHDRSVAATKAVAAAAAKAAEASNPGSIGHPDLCSRPCLYHQQGGCANGLGCNFCHFPHPQRTLHLGRQHRKMLETIPIDECLAMVLPVLEEKLEALNLPMSALAELRSLACTSSQPSGSRTGVRAKDERSLTRALRAMYLRSLLTALRSTIVPRGGPEQAVFESVIYKLRAHASRGQAIEAFPLGADARALSL